MVIFLFWLGAMVLALLALALLLPPLLRGRRADTADQRRQLERELAALKARHENGSLDATSYAAAREQLSTQLIAAIEAGATPDPAAPAPARGLALVLALLVPVLALAVYFAIGRPDALDFRTPAMADAQAMPMDMAQAVASLEQRLREEPDNLEGWLLLARSYRAMERFDDMLRATSSAMALAPEQPHVMVEHAEAVALAGPTRRLDGPARDLLDQALAIDPQQHKALWLVGIAELQQENHLEAIVYWQRLRALLAPDDPVIASLDRQIAAARTGAGLPADPVADDSGNDARVDAGIAAATGTPGGQDSAADAGDGPLVRLQIDLEPALAGRVRPGDTLFVFARAPDGGPPLAIRRISNPQFPVTVSLGPEHRMIDGVQLRHGEPVNLGARISHSGQAQPESGDLEAAPLALTPSGQDSAQLRIDRVLP